MFYESERIVRKQRLFINQKANEMLSKFKAQKLDPAEISAALELLLEDPEGSETHVEIVERALIVLKNDRENNE